jgi:uncharacterized protein (TIGR02246 family)
MKVFIQHLALVLLTATFAPAQQEDPNKSKLEALAANAASFVNPYNKEDPDALAKMFLPDGEIVLADGEVVAGRDDIREFYTEIFSGDEKSKAALEAGSVRLVTPCIAIEDDTLHLTKSSGEVASQYDTAVQVKQENGTWLTASVRDEIGDHAPANEKLIALQWLIGDWLIEQDGCRTFITFSWSDDAPYLDGTALTEDACDDKSPDAPPPPAPVPLEKLTGTWVSDRGPQGTATLALSEGGKFAWTYKKGEKTREFSGSFSINKVGLLALDAEESQMVAAFELPQRTTK